MWHLTQNVAFAHAKHCVCCRWNESSPTMLSSSICQGVSKSSQASYSQPWMCWVASKLGCPRWWRKSPTKTSVLMPFSTKIERNIAKHVNKWKIWKKVFTCYCFRIPSWFQGFASSIQRFNKTASKIWGIQQTWHRGVSFTGIILKVISLLLQHWRQPKNLSHRLETNAIVPIVHCRVT